MEREDKANESSITKLAGKCDDANHVRGEHDADDHVGSAAYQLIEADQNHVV